MPSGPEEYYATLTLEAPPSSSALGSYVRRSRRPCGRSAYCRVGGFVTSTALVIACAVLHLAPNRSASPRRTVRPGEFLEFAADKEDDAEDWHKLMAKEVAKWEEERKNTTSKWRTLMAKEVKRYFDQELLDVQGGPAKPAPKKAPPPPPPPPPPPKKKEEPCHTTVKGEKCYDSVMWALNTGIAKKPGWFPGLTPKSSFEDVQSHYYGDPKSDGTCKKPCPPCHTAVKGEKCYSSVHWALKQGGIAKHPDWFVGLTPKSTFEAVQLHFYNDPKSRADQCAHPCM